MKTPASSVALTMVVLSFVSMLSGCSLIGFAIDMSTPPDTLAATSGDKGLEGKNVLVTLRDGFRFAGECRKVGLLPANLYRSRFVQWQKGIDTCIFPFTPGDTIMVARESGQVARGSLEGFSRNSVVILPLQKENSPLRLPGPHVLAIPVEEVDSLRKSVGPSIPGRVLMTQFRNGDIPTTGGMLVRRGETFAWTPLDDIAEVQEIRYTYDWLHKGAIADAVGLAVAVAYLAAKK